MSICFNINNYHSFLTLFKSYTFDSRDRKDFYKRGDKNCINNMRQYFGSSSDYKEFTNFTNQNQNKNPNIFHLYYKNISKILKLFFLFLKKIYKKLKVRKNIKKMKLLR